MVRIIKHGVIKRDIRQFTCDVCDCVFEMDRLKYSKSLVQTIHFVEDMVFTKTEPMYLAICPECGHLVKVKGEENGASKA